MDSYLYQWYGGTVLSLSNIECMVSLEQDGCIEVKIRGSKSSSYTCFYFLEEILHSINLVIYLLKHFKVIFLKLLSNY